MSNPLEKLTPRELEVAQLVGETATTPAIAKTLAISPHTVRSHLRSIRRKLGLSNRIQVAIWWVTHGSKGE